MPLYEYLPGQESPSEGVMKSAELNEYGALGWELVSVIKVDGCYQHTFKRSLEPEKQRTLTYLIISSSTGGQLDYRELENRSKEGWELVEIIKISSYISYFFVKETK